MDFTALSALPTLLGVAGFALALERIRRHDADGEGAAGDAERRLLCFLALLFVALLAETALLTKNVRYVALLELPLRLFAVGAIWHLVPVRGTLARVGATAALVALLVLVDVRSFEELFLRHGLYDPMSAPLLELRGVVPSS